MVHAVRMRNDRGPSKSNVLECERLKNGKLKNRWKEAVEKNMVDRGLKRTDALDLLICKCGCKTHTVVTIYVERAVWGRWHSFMSRI